MKNLLHPVLGFPVNPSIHWQLQTWLNGVPKALGPQGSRMHGSAQVKLLLSQYLVVWQSGSTRHSGTIIIKKSLIRNLSKYYRFAPVLHYTFLEILECLQLFVFIMKKFRMD